MSSLYRLLRARRRAEETEPRSLRERGAAALEFALIAPLFFLVVFGGIEIGYMFRNNLALQDSVRSAARVASVQRNDPGADLAILEKINGRVGELNGDVVRIVIFAAPTLNSEVPSSCVGAGAASNGTDNCNVYTINNGDIQEAIDNFAQETGIDNDNERNAYDNIGIYVEYDYEYVTGFFDTITLSASSIEVIELDL